MKLLKCFTQKKSTELINAGFEFLYKQNGVYYFEYNQDLANENILKDTKFSTANF